MKKKLLFFTLAFCLFLSACSAPAAPTTAAPLAAPTVDLNVMGDSNPMPGFDAQNKFSYMAFCAFQETDNFFFGNTMGEQFLRYYDKITGNSDVLCSDPICMHSDKTCGAYFDGNASAFFYNGQRWWISRKNKNDVNLYLYRSDISGQNQEQVKCIAFADVVLAYQPQQYAIHRGNLFIRGIADVVDGTSAKKRLTLLASPLDGTEAFTVLFDQTFDFGDGSGSNSSMRFVGTKVYYSLQTWGEDQAVTLTIFSYDVATKKSETVYSESNIQASLGEPWVTEDGEIYVSSTDSTDIASLWKLENNQRVKAASWSIENAGRSYVADGVVVNVKRVNGIRGIDVRDFSGNILVSTDTLFPDKIPGLAGDPNQLGYSVIGGDQEKVIIILESCTVLIDVQNDAKVTLLWSSGE